MKRLIVLGIALLALAPVGLFAASVRAQPPNLIAVLQQDVASSLAMVTRGPGGTYNQPKAPVAVVADDDGTVTATFKQTTYAPAVSFDLLWDGAKFASVPAPHVHGLIWNYRVEVKVTVFGGYSASVTAEHKKVYLGHGRYGYKLAPFTRVVLPELPGCVIVLKPCNGCPLECAD